MALRGLQVLPKTLSIVKELFGSYPYLVWVSTHTTNSGSVSPYSIGF
ncbi:hypothetical protein HPSA20_0849 [Helicobacter pylori SouthAfrica20]|uniref:Uncharacterized protein n=1 Tax=Helicobacter pylori SouthAfrica20 TaxID=1352356 RepID=T1U9M7_HELPX|nr:hypothetical protein HPSA20_0849 [Helicobacter pylori SouthAfrica20]